MNKNKIKINPYEDENEVEYYIKMLHSEELADRALAADTLGWLKNKRAVEPLIAALKSDDSYLREWSATALAQIGDTHAVEPLISVWKTIESQMFRHTACQHDNSVVTSTRA